MLAVHTNAGRNVEFEDGELLMACWLRRLWSALVSLLPLVWARRWTRLARQSAR
jgi:hypothetical protein